MYRIKYLLLICCFCFACGQKESDRPITPIHGDILRGPYLQSATDSSIKVIFYSTEKTISELQLGTDSLPGRKFRTVQATQKHVYFLKGLLPGQSYRYAVRIKDKTYTGEHWHFTTATTHNTDGIRFWAMGDFGAGNDDQRKVRQAFQQYLAENPVDFWLWLGDNAYPDGTLSQFHNKVFDAHYGYDSLMKFLPFYPTPGNHDYNGMSKAGGNFHRHNGPYYDLTDVFQHGEGGGVPSGTELYYSFDRGPAHFIMLNSEVWRFSVLGNDQMKDWLEKDLEANAKKWTVVFFHQPPYSFGSHRSDTRWEVVMRGMRRKYLPLLEQYGADLVLNGHSHVYERSYLVNGHYEVSGKFETHHIVDKGTKITGTDVYHKKKTGTIYAVAGNGGKDFPLPPEPHPVMAFGYGGEHKCGSLIVSIKGDTLKGDYLDTEGKILDRFAVVKRP